MYFDKNQRIGWENLIPPLMEVEPLTVTNEEEEEEEGEEVPLELFCLH